MIGAEEESRWLSCSPSPLSSSKQIANASVVNLAVRCLLTSNAFLLLILPIPDTCLLIFAAMQNKTHSESQK